MRPDQCGAIIQLDTKWKDDEIITATPTGEEIPKETLDWLMAYSRQHSMPLLWCTYVMSGGKLKETKRMSYGPLWFMQTVANEILAEDITKI